MGGEGGPLRIEGIGDDDIGPASPEHIMGLNEDSVSSADIDLNTFEKVPVRLRFTYVGVWELLYPRFNEVERGVYWYHLVRLSVRPCVRPSQ